MKFYAWLDDEHDKSSTEIHDESIALFRSSPYESRHPWISEERECPSTMTDDPESWLIYIPFDTCSFKLGGSLLTQTNGHNGGMAPDIKDPDYFIDCYEVVRELVEDGVIMSGINATDGGLITAAAEMCGKYGMDIDIKGIMSSYQDAGRSRILFGEVPGIIIQISDENYDYVDSQLLLQDIAYYPIGRPSLNHSGIKISEDRKNGVADILAALLNQASEGED